jgi:hypothetical protein
MRVTQAVEAPVVRRFQVLQVDAELVKANAPPVKHE